MAQRRVTAEEYRALPLEAYQRSAAAEVWLVDTESDTVLECRDDEALEVGRGEAPTTPLLPGLAIDLASLFDR